LAEFVRVRRDLLLQRIRAERSQQRAAPGEDAERRAERGAAQDRLPHAPPVFPGRPEAAYLAGEDLAMLLLLEVADDLGDAEHAHRDRDEADAVGKLRDAERKAQHTGVHIRAYETEQQ